MDDEQAALEIAYRSLAYKLRGNFNAWLGLQSPKSRETASDKVTTSTTTTTSMPEAKPAELPSPKEALELLWGAVVVVPVAADDDNCARGPRLKTPLQLREFADRTEDPSEKEKWLARSQGAGEGDRGDGSSRRDCQGA